MTFSGVVTQLRRALFPFVVILQKEPEEDQTAKRKDFMKYRSVPGVEVDTQFEIALIPGFASKDRFSESEQYLGPVFRILSKMISNLVTS